MTATVAKSVEPTDRVRRPKRPSRALLIGGIAVAVVVAIGVLIWPSPPGPLVVHAGTSHYVLTATIDSPRIGSTDIDIDLTDRAGRPVRRAAIGIEAIMPLMGYAAPVVAATSVDSTHFHAAGVPLMMTGPWELRLSVAAPDGVDSLVLPLSVTG